ncbi:MAG: DUF1653 domain-containing protein [Candidatus Diapherotrites archaeon]|uniref:DUF1653 domain-containing protein n=1 Tax=Candidatus Iainarchaeum sp. TaxID=3101447 RepID=A0A8T5GGA3_9ARCH|nr:DUF1653 domain-containing protein [Candidatus Diapherotrites archaeon]MBT7241385.1 DUF1653 domain-containing protein [Candidatus Diapherotrites archaeon]
MELEVGQIWNHYKRPSQRYEIIAIAKDSDTLEEVIVYKALYQGEFKFGQIWARKINDFLGTVEKNGEQINRFNLVEE